MFTCESLYEECRTKYGFSDGNAVPPGAGECRDLLVEAINGLAPADATVEAYAYDRAGMHNPYLILWRAKGSQAEEERPHPDWLDEVITALDDEGYLFLVTSAVIEVSLPEERKAILMRLCERLEV